MVQEVIDMIIMRTDRIGGILSRWAWWVCGVFRTYRLGQASENEQLTMHTAFQ